jgi:3-oxoacyl-[acyl-carrier-protein] synthase III
MAFHVMGTGSARPEKVVTNDDLSKFLDTDDAWISSRTGISSRRACTTQTCTDLAEQAALAALENAGVAPEELDLIICSTITADDLTPSCAAMVQARIGATCPAFDINAACAGFVFALDVAHGYFARGAARRVLVVSAEKMSRMVDWTERSVSVLFGDGAGAVVLGAGGESPLYTKLTTKGAHDTLYCPSMRGNSPFDATPLPEPFLHMKGQEVFKFAVTSICADVRQMCQSLSITPDQVDLFVFHQANKRILDSAVEKLGLDRDKVAYTIQDSGNISSACIPLTLDRLNREGRLRQGDLVCCSGFGAGLVVATTLLKWGQTQ